MDTPVVEPRWPPRECFHRNIAFSYKYWHQYEQGLIDRIPIVCLDCGFKSGDSAK